MCSDTRSLSGVQINVVSEDLKHEYENEKFNKFFFLQITDQANLASADFLTIEVNANCGQDVSGPLAKGSK